MTTALGKHGLEWQEWILRNLSRQCTPHSMFERMVSRVWTGADAAAALDAGLAELGMGQVWRTPLPEIRLSPDGPVKVLGQLERPHAVLMDGLLSRQECLELIAYAEHKGLKASAVVDQQTGQSVAHQARTSSSVCLSRAETALVDAVENRLASLTNWPVSHGEGLQILRYEPGQQYRPHFDWFDPEKPGSASHLRRGGQRVGTTVIYLATAETGGGTQFPKAGLEVSPSIGGGVFFKNLDYAGKPDEMSLHAGTPVVQGTKIVMTYWQREESFR